MIKSNYQQQKFYIKIYRWLKYKPLYLIKFISNVLYFIFEKDLCLTTQEERLHKNAKGYIGHLWRTNMAIADYDMGNCLTTEELLCNLKESGRL